MIKKIILITSCIWFGVSMHAQQNKVVTVYAGKQISINTGTPVEQKKIGDAGMEFIYDYCYLTDTTDVTSENKDMMILQVGLGFSKFSSYRAMQIDSLISASTTDQIRENPSRYVGGETFSVYKNYPPGKFTTTDKISTDWYLYEEPIPIQEWNTGGDSTKEILGYKCRMAECDFRGRHYIAWYSEEIPVADGPRKFGGLPGFILEVCDTDGYYQFTLVGINSKATRPVTMPDVQYNRTNRSKFYNTKLRYDTDPTGYMRDVSGVSVVITSPDGTTRNEHPRERMFDYIERDYKR
ncbi:MAG: GLPGLI family protein [Tannerellaceae bacterium]|jgi:GLPGLI family protein|nr:GLPGLI family protein [Tannerellaceae bacterium]